MRELMTDGERGAVLVFTVLTVVVVFGAGVLAVDAGAVWLARRSLVTGTDAAALAAANSYAFRPDASYQCGSAALAELLDRNSGGAEIEECDPVTEEWSGYVTVSAESAEVPVSFGRVLGLREPTVGASSTAMWATPTTVIGLRPIALCLDHPAVRALLDAASGVHRVPFGKNASDDCGPAPGNWGWMNFEHPRNSGSSDLRRWLRQGYFGRVAVGDCKADGSNQGCAGMTGELGNSPEEAMRFLKDSGQPFAVFLFDTSTGSGSNIRYNVYGFLGVVLHGYQLLGADHERYLDLEFRNVVVEGLCCGTHPGRGVHVVRLCSTDGIDPTDRKSHCAAS